MNKVPCLLCNLMYSVPTKKILAIICTKCQLTKDIDTFLKQLTLRNLSKNLNQSKSSIYTNEFGEVLTKGGPHAKIHPTINSTR